MSHFLDANQLSEACEELGLEDEKELLLVACELAGQAIARKLSIAVVSSADDLPGFGGLCVGFGPAAKGQPCPKAILEFDGSSDWHDETVNAG